jgi:GDP-4-dehydro-6-deoxy-D-mannose reductase
VTASSVVRGRTLPRYRPCVPLVDNGRCVDLRHIETRTRAIGAVKPGAVSHLTAQSFVPQFFADPRETYEINLLGTLKLLAALKGPRFAGRFLFVGSGDSYGLLAEGNLPVTEEYPLRPRNPYAVSKVAAEALCYQWNQTEGLDAVMTHSFNHIGSGQNDRFAVSDFARQVVEIRKGRREPVIRVGDIDVPHDFTDVRDVMRAHLLLVDLGRGGEPQNVAVLEWSTRCARC